VKRRAKPKFHLGQVVSSSYYRDHFFKIRARKFGAGVNNHDEWGYSSMATVGASAGAVYFEESALRPLTKREIRS